MRRGWSGVALACGAALAFAGCGTAEEQERERSERSRARAALLTVRDLPKGWTVAADMPDGPFPTRERLAQLCPGYPGDWLTTHTDADAGFEAGELLVAQSVTLVDADDVPAMMRDFDSDRARRCMRAIVAESFEQAAAEQQLRLESIAVRQLRRAAGDGDAMRLAIELSSADGSVTVPMRMDVVAASAGPAVSALTLSAVGSGAEVDEALRDRLAEVAQQRLDAEFAGG